MNLSEIFYALSYQIRKNVYYITLIIDLCFKAMFVLYLYT